MSSESAELFSANIELWSRSYPREALYLSYLEEGELELCYTERGEPNLCKRTAGAVAYFHDPSGASDEAEAWFSNLSLRNVQVLYIYGVGLGYYYDAAKKWLRRNPLRALAFVEDDLYVLKKFFATARASEMLADRQVHLVYLKDFADKKEILGELYWKFAMTKACVTALNYYQTCNKKLYEELCREIAYSADLKRELLGEYLQFGASYFINCYQNLLHLPNSYLANGFFGKFSNVPAIICGAGPSLQKNMALLHQLRQRALIFAGGSAINILNKAAIEPHLCVAIDPNPAQQVRLHHARTFEVPFFYRNRLNHQAFNAIHGPRIYVTGSGGYDIAQFFEEKFSIEGVDLEEGHNLVTFATEIAHLMGCNPLIYVGMDLAFTGRQSYSPGVVLHPSLEGKASHRGREIEKIGFLRNDIDNNPVYTQWKWVAESEWLGEWAKEHKSITVLNCTEGGLGFPGVRNQPLAKVALTELGREYDLDNAIFVEMQNSRLSAVASVDVVDALRSLQESLSRCNDYLAILIEESEKLSITIAKEHETPPQLSTAEAALAEVELADEVGYRYVLDIFNLVYNKLLTSEFDAIIYGKRVKAEWRKKRARVELNIKRLKFLEDTSAVNIKLLQLALNAQEKRENTYAKEKPPELEQAESPKPLKGEQIPFPKASGDKKIEVEQVYYENGQLKSERYWCGSKLNGSARYWSEKGVLLVEGQFDNGMATGELRWYYSTGELYSVQRFEKGVWHGKQEYYQTNGVQKTIANYRHGVLKGDLELYAEGGGLKRRIHFD